MVDGARTWPLARVVGTVPAGPWRGRGAMGWQRTGETGVVNRPQDGHNVQASEWAAGRYGPPSLIPGVAQSPEKSGGLIENP
jgi:hypothetical protein